MDILEIMKARHSVRQYSGKKIESGIRETLAALVSECNSMPDWFSKGMEAALLAPTAMNQQKFYITLENGKVSAKAGRGFYTKMDLGIVKYHFEVATGHKVE